MNLLCDTPAAVLAISFGLYVFAAFLGAVFLVAISVIVEKFKYRGKNARN